MPKAHEPEAMVTFVPKGQRHPIEMPNEGPLLPMGDTRPYVLFIPMHF